MKYSKIYFKKRGSKVPFNPVHHFFGYEKDLLSQITLMKLIVIILVE